MTREMLNMRSIVSAATVCLLVLGSLGVAACGPSGPRGGPLEEVAWVLSSFSEAGSMKAVPAGISVELLFKAGEASGKAVNSYNGPYSSTADGKITIGPIASTLMAGPPDQMAVEQAYFKALEKAASYYSDGKQLTLYDSGGAALLVFGKSTASLTGRVWSANGVNNGKQAVVGLVASSEITAEFLPDGSVRGNGGINTYSAPYTVTGTDGISVGPPIATKAAGAEEVMRQEQQYFTALQTAKKYVLRGSRLELRTAQDALAVSYETTGTPK
jgi:heat shock protein HslJ